MTRARLVLLAVFLVGGVLAARVAAGMGGMGGMSGRHMGSPGTPASFRSDGEQIYFTGTSGSGRPITFTGGDMRVGMHGGGCAACHGRDGRGGLRGMPRFWVVSADIRAGALFGDGHDGSAGGEHGDHEAYTDETLSRAITDGLDPAGRRLHPVMPRWRMDPTDLRELIAYLREL